MNRIVLIARISRRGMFGVMWREIDDSCGGSSRHLQHMALHELVEERLTGSVIGAFFEVYNNLGYGFLDRLAEQRLDMIVDQKLVVETKSTHELHKSANRQVYNYLRSTNLEVGLLLHFGPDARFYRVVHRNKNNPDPSNQENPIHPDEPSVSVVRAEKPFPSSVIDSSASLRT
jgi:hypothetical protein